MKNILKAFLVTAATALVVACGGSGTGGGKPNGPAAVLRIHPPVDTVTIPVGGGWAEVGQLRGGTKPYVFSFSGTDLESAMYDDFLYIRAAAEGSGDFGINDESLPVQGVKFKVTSKVVALTGSAGTAINIGPNQSQNFNIMGGGRPYTVTSSDSSVATASVSGSTVTVTSRSRNGTATITVTDATGVSTLTVTVTVQLPGLSASPASVTGLEGSTKVVTVVGGLAPYTATSDNAGIADGTVSNPTATAPKATVTVSLKGVGTTNITVMDAAGQVSVIPVTVTTNTIKITPTGQDINERSRVVVKYLINGGTAPYTPMISIADQDSIWVAISNKELSAALRACVTEDKTIPIDVYDANLLKQTVTLTIKNDTTLTDCPGGFATAPTTTTPAPR